MLLILFSHPLYRWLTSRQPIQGPIENTALLDSLLISIEELDSTKDVLKTENIKRFNFDPNLASEDELVSLGISSYLSQRIINYRSKGGVFRIKPDLLKIYGMDSSLYASLEPFIQLPFSVDRENKVEEIGAIRPEDFFDINLTDTTTLKSIKGIGPVLSNRIVKYRNRLGGFVQLEQLKEVWGLDSTVIHSLKEKCFIREGFAPTTININTATEDEISNHPYFNIKIGKAIAAYRFQHGSFKEIDDLLAIELIQKENFHKVRPYLSAR